MLTLKEVNSFAKGRLTLGQVKQIHDKHGYAAVLFAGKIVEFVPKGFVERKRVFEERARCVV